MKPGWRNLVVLLAALFMSATGALAVENRFLLVVEASADSAKNTQATRDAVADLLVKGFNGIIRPGDTIGVWVAGERLDTTFPMWVWQPAVANKYAVQADAFIAKRPWTGRWNPADTAAALKNVASNSEALTVILVTAPGSRLGEMPFSESVVAIQDKAAPDLERTKLPFVTFATVREREFVSAVVNSGVGPWTIPNPPLPKPASAPAATPASVPKPVIASKSIVGNATKIEFPTTPPPRPTEVKAVAEPVPAAALEPKLTLAAAPVVQPESKALANTPEAKPVIQAAPVEAAPKAAAVSQEVPQVPVPESVKAGFVAKTNPETTDVQARAEASVKIPELSATAVPVAVPSPDLGAAQKGPQEFKPSSTSAAVSMASIVTPQRGGNGFFIAGIAAVLGLVALGWLALRRPKAAQRSLITESYRSK